MNKILLTLTLSLFLIGGVMAFNIYGGETVYYPLTNYVQNITALNYSIVNNTYNLDGLDVTWNSTGLLVHAAINYRPDNFIILVNISGYNNQIEVPSSSGSGESSGPCITTWKCSDWLCNFTTGIAIRSCSKEKENCMIYSKVPNEQMFCYKTPENNTQSEPMTPIYKIINSKEPYQNLPYYMLWFFFGIALIYQTIMFFKRKIHQVKKERYKGGQKEDE